jgi:hypothetical protein
VGPAAEQAAAAGGIDLDCVDVVNRNPLGETFVTTLCRLNGAPENGYIYSAAEIIKPLGVQTLAADIAYLSQDPLGQLGPPVEIIPRVSGAPLYGPDFGLAEVFRINGSVSATAAARNKLSQGSPLERAIAATGEFVVAPDGTIIITGNNWQGIAGVFTGTYTPSAPLSSGGGPTSPPLATTPAAPTSRPRGATRTAQEAFLAPAAGGGVAGAGGRVGGTLTPRLADPVGIPFLIKVIVTTALGALFRGIFGGISGAVKTALESLRGAITTGVDANMRFAWRIGNGLASVLSGLHAVWVRVIAPILRRVLELTGRIHEIIDKVLRPALRVIDRIRQMVLDIYEKYVRPVLVIIQMIRQVLAILKLFHVRWAEKLDAYLVELEARIMRPLQEVLQRTAWLAGWINTILNSRYLIQEPIFVNTMAEHADKMSALVFHAHHRPLTDTERALLRPVIGPPPASTLKRDLDQYLRSGSGPIAEHVARLKAELASQGF